MNKIAEVIEGKRRFAVFPIVCVDHGARLLRMDLAEVVGNGEKIAQVLECAYKTYNYDMVLVFSDPYVEAQAMGCPVEFAPYPRLLTKNNPPITLSSKGGVRADSKGEQSPCIPLWKRGSEGDLETYSVERIDRTSEIIKAARLLQKRIDVPIFVSIKGPFSLAAFLAGIENFLKMLLINDKEARNFIDRAIEFQVRYLERLLSLSVNIFIGDPMASTSVVSPELFNKFAYEPLRILIEKVKDCELIVGLHICGETKPIIPILDNLGADILSIEDISLPTRTLKMGGVSTTTIFSGTQTEIKAEVTKALSQPHLILATSCDVPPETNQKNIKTMIESAYAFSEN